jgi:polar amino acid transport system substrate-binding protein
LQRHLQHATLVHADSVQASNALFVNEKLDALAGLKTGLLTAAQSIPGSRVLDGQFTGIQQAIATKTSNLEAVQFLTGCVERFISTGLVADLIQKYQVQGLAPAPLYRHS